MNKFSVIGNPINHSLSPMIHQEFAKEFGIDLSYEKILSPVDAFNLTAEKFISSGGLGFNITLPFKINAYSFSENLTENAKAAGAVNTINIDNNIIYGENTDGAGLVNDLENNLEQKIKDKVILVIGAGGATQGILKPILDKNPEKYPASRLVTALERCSARVRFKITDWEAITASPYPRPTQLR